MSPEEYREKWGLARDYPMVAPAYAAARSHLAKTMGLGRQSTKGAGAEPAAKSPKNSAKQNPREYRCQGIAQKVAGIPVELARKILCP